MKKFTVLLLSILLIGSYSFAQTKDSTSEDNFDQNKKEFKHKHKKGKFHMSFKQSIDAPTIELNYGLTKPLYERGIFKPSFADVSNVEARFGFRDVEENKDGVYDYEMHYFYISNISNDILKAYSKDDKFKTKSWSFGFGNQTGWGYGKPDEAGLILYHGGGLGWTRTEFLNPEVYPVRVENNFLPTDDFNKTFRFSEYFESGLKFKVAKPLAINLAFQEGIVYPRHMFWYWSLSKIIEGGSQGIADWFVSEVRESSPTLAPVVGLIVKSGISYGIYELRKENMNWPTSTAAPLMFQQFKVGLSFDF